MLNVAPSEFDEAHLAVPTSVDTVCAMGTCVITLPMLSTTIKNSHMLQRARGLFCAQLLTRVLVAFAEAAIAGHLPADFIDAVNDGGMVSAAECLPDFH
jgi:hypothetical protein